MAKPQKTEKNKPAPWKPIDIKRFNKNTQAISEIFRKDPARLNEKQDNNDGRENNNINK